MIEEFDNKSLQDFSYETTIISEDGKIVGCCELGKATIQMLNKSNQYSNLKGTWIKTIHGSFYIYDVKPVQEKINIKLDCYDIKYRLNTDYDSSLYTFPMTLKEWRNAIFTNCGVEYDDSDFPNCDLLLEEEPYLDDNIKNIQVISMIAEAGASNVITDSNDKFYFSWIENTVHEIKDWLELTTESSSVAPINAVVLGRSTGDDIFYPNPTPENSHIFRIDNNYILDPQSINKNEDRRNQTIQSIYNQLNEFTYVIYSMRSQSIDNKLTIKLGDKISYTDIWGNNLESIVMTKIIHWLGGDPADSNNYEISLSAEECSYSNDSTGSQNSIPGKINILSRKADKQEGIIQDLIKKTDESNEKIVDLTLTSDEISASVSEINNKYEKDITTTKEAQGNPIEVNDAGNYDLESIEIEGKSYQKTTTGKNKFASIPGATVNGVTFTHNEEDDSYDIVGTASDTGSATIAKFISLDDSKIENGKTYTLSTNIETDSNDILIVSEFYNNNSWLRVLCNNAWKSNISNTTNANRVRFYIKVLNGKTVNIKGLKIQLEEGNKATEIEPYTGGIPSPNPEFPQKIEVVKGVTNFFKNDFKDTTKNGITLTVDKNKIHFEGTATDKTNINIPYSFPNDFLNKTLTFQVKGFKSSGLRNCGFKKGTSTDIHILSYATDDTITFNVTQSDIDNINTFDFYILKDSVVSGDVYIQLEEDTVAHSSVPYGTWLKQKTNGKNICKTDSYDWELGIYSVQIGEKQNYPSRARLIDLIKVETNRTLYFDTNNPQYRFVIRTYDKNKSFKRSIGAVFSTHTLALNEKEYYISVSIYNFNTDASTQGQLIIDYIKDGTIKPFICYDEIEDKSYEPYKENTSLIDMNIYDDEGNIVGNHELLKINDAVDTFKNGILTKKIGKIILDGSSDEIWSMSSNGNFFYINLSNIYLANNDDIPNILSTKYLPISFSVGYNSTDSTIKGITCHSSERRLGIRDKDFNSVQELRESLQETPLIVYYGLYKEELFTIDYELLQLFEGYNYITLNDELMPNMNINYLTDSKLNGQYATRSELKLTEKSITSSLNKKITDTNNETIEKMENVIERKIDDSENSIKLEVSNTYSTKTETANAINDIEIGGRNLLLGTNEGSSRWHYFKSSGSATTETYENVGVHFNVTEVASGSGSYQMTCYDFDTSQAELLEPNTQYTLSMDIKTNMDTTSATAVIKRSNATNPLTSTVTQPIVNDNKFHKVVWVLTTNDLSNSLEQQYIYINGFNKLGDLYIKNIKLEKGNKATDWTPAPEDVTAEIGETENKINAKLELKVAKTENNQVVTMLNASANEINIKGNRFVLDSTNFKVDKNGNIVATNGKFVGGTLILEDNGTSNEASIKIKTKDNSTGSTITRETTYSGYGIEADIVTDYDYTQQDLTTLQNLILSGSTPTQAQLKRYDANGDGKLSSVDLAMINKIIMMGVNKSNHGHFSLDTHASFHDNIVITDGNGNKIVGIGLFGLEAYAGNLYYKDEDVYDIDNLHTGGYVTGSGKTFYLGTIFVQKSLEKVTSITLESGATLQVRQGGNYLVGDSSGGVNMNPNYCKASKAGDNAIMLQYNATSAPSNVKNNDSIGVAIRNLRLTFHIEED